MLCMGLPLVPARAGAETKDSRQNGLLVVPSLSVTYDDNVYRVDRRAVAPIDDVIVSPGVELQFTRDIGIRAFSLRAAAAYDQFLSQTRQSKLRLDGAITGEAQIAGICAIRPLASYRQRRADYGDINSTTDNLQRFSTLSVAADCKRPAGLYPLAAIKRDTTRNGNAFDYADQTAYSWRAGIGYARPSLGVVTTYYEHQRSRRPRLALTNSSDAFGVSFDRSVTPVTTFSADVRWMRVRSTSPTIGRYNGPAWNVSLTSIALAPLRITGTTERTIVNDSLISTGFAIRTASRLGAQLPLSELTSIELFAERARRHFRQDAALRPFNYTSDRTDLIGLTVKRKVNDRLSVDLDASRYVRKTNSNAANYRAFRATVGITAEF